MGLFDSFKKEKKTDFQEPDERPELSKVDYISGLGGVFVAQLLMKEPCEMPSQERMCEVLSKHLGAIETVGFEKDIASFAAKDYLSQLEDGNFPVILAVSACEPFEADAIPSNQRNQIWTYSHEEIERMLSDCHYQILVNDMLGGGLPSQVRANFLMDYLEALVELYPQCEAVYLRNSGKLVKADELRAKEVTGSDRFVKYAVNARLFQVEGTEDCVIDTIGMGLLVLEDIQYHFHGMDPNEVAFHAYSTASYLLENEKPIQDGDTIDGVREGELVRDIQWKCRHEEALVEPARCVIDVHMGEYAAGEREEQE